MRSCHQILLKAIRPCGDMSPQQPLLCERAARVISGGPLVDATATRLTTGGHDEARAIPNDGEREWETGTGSREEVVLDLRTSFNPDKPKGCGVNRRIKIS